MRSRRHLEKNIDFSPIFKRRHQLEKNIDLSTIFMDFCLPKSTQNRKKSNKNEKRNLTNLVLETR